MTTHKLEHPDSGQVIEADESSVAMFASQGWVKKPQKRPAPKKPSTNSAD